MPNKFTGRARTLRERAVDYIDGSSRPGIDDRDRVAWWVKVYFDGKRGRLNRHLRSAGIDPAAFLSVVASSSATVKSRKSYESRSKIIPLPCPHYGDGGTSRLCGSYLAKADRQFLLCLDRAIGSALIVDATSIISDFRRFIYGRVADLLTPSLIMEANITRLTRVQAVSPSAGFELFVASLSQKEAQRRFWDKYPALRRRILCVIRNTTRTCIETVSRVTQDRKKIEAAFKINITASLRSIAFGSGDSHNGGRVVAILHFAGAKLVYKPRSLTADDGYNSFLKWYGTKCLFPAVRPHKILNCGGYGYAEFIRARKSVNPNELKTSYYKQGQLLAIAWLLGISDIHHENLIASGCDPYIVDVEVMFDRPCRSPASLQSTGGLYGMASEAFLLRTGILPIRRRGAFGIYNVSAIGATSNQFAPLPVQRIKNPGRDDVRFVSARARIRNQRNGLAFKDAAHSPQAHAAEIMRGHSDALAVLAAARGELLAQCGPLRAFQEAKLRWVARDTAQYADLLSQMRHPAVMKDALECDMVMAGALRRGVDAARYLEPLIQSEISDLWDDDVPYFWTMFDSCSVFDSHGHEVMAFFSESCIAGVERRLVQMSNLRGCHLESIDLAIKSLSTLQTGAHTSLGVERPFDPHVTVTDDEVISSAIDIGYQLIDRKCDIKGKPFWMGLVPLDETSFTAKILPPTVYDGPPGIGVFLARLFQCTGLDDFRSAASEVHNLLHVLMRSPMPDARCGAFSGYSSLIYADILISDALGLKLTTSNVALRRLRRLVENDEGLDLMTGAAGALLVSMRWHAKTNLQDACVTAASAARKLIERAERQRQGTAWHTVGADASAPPLGGLSHGVTGIGWALSEWADFSGDKEARRLAEEAFLYDSTLFDEKRGEWIDARHRGRVSHWCHGAVGIGLGASKVCSTLGEAACAKIVHYAQASVWRQGVMNNHCLCHGNLGNSEIFLANGDRERSRRVLSNVFSDYRARQMWQCDLPGSRTAPGLLCGLAGVGYSLLRHIFTDRVPSILTLDC